MIRLLCFISLLLSLEAYAQVQVTDTSRQIVPVNSVSRLIIERYCDDGPVYTLGDLGIKPSQQKLDLSLKYDPRKPIDYSKPNYYSYTYPPLRYTNSGLTVGTANINMFNPHGAGSVSEALVFGTVNYFLNKRHK